MVVNRHETRIIARLTKGPASSYEIDGRGTCWRTLMDMWKHGRVRMIGPNGNAQLTFALLEPSA